MSSNHKAGTRGASIQAFVAAIMVALCLTSAALAQGMMGGPRGTAAPPPTILKQVGIEQRLDAQLPLELAFRDESGREVGLSEFFGHRPVVLSLVYYNCPMLCGEVLNGMASVFSVLKFDIGKDFDVITVSFDPRETPDLARGKKRIFMERYGRPGAEQGWHFLTGSKESIDALTRATGFNYAWDEQSQQFAHAAAIMVATPSGKISKYFYGVEYAPKDLRFGLIQASENRIGTVVDQVLLYCYHYDPRTGKYGAIISHVMQLAGVATILILGGLLIVMFRSEPQSSRTPLGRSKGGNA